MASFYCEHVRRAQQAAAEAKKCVAHHASTMLSPQFNYGRSRRELLQKSFVSLALSPQKTSSSDPTVNNDPTLWKQGRQQQAPTYLIPSSPSPTRSLRSPLRFSEIQAYFHPVAPSPTSPTCTYAQHSPTFLIPSSPSPTRSLRSPLSFSEIQAYFDPQNLTTHQSSSSSSSSSGSQINRRALDQAPHKLGPDRRRVPAATPSVVVYNPQQTLTPVLRNQRQGYTSPQMLSMLSSQSRMRASKRANRLREMWM